MSKDETFLCQKYEDLIEHVKQKAQEDDEADAMIGSKRREPFAENRGSLLQSQLGAGMD